MLVREKIRYNGGDKEIIGYYDVKMFTFENQIAQIIMEGQPTITMTGDIIKDQLKESENTDFDPEQWAHVEYKVFTGERYGAYETHIITVVSINES